MASLSLWSEAAVAGGRCGRIPCRSAHALPAWLLSPWQVAAMERGAEHTLVQAAPAAPHRRLELHVSAAISRAVAEQRSEFAARAALVDAEILEYNVRRPGRPHLHNPLAPSRGGAGAQQGPRGRDEGGGPVDRLPLVEVLRQRALCMGGRCSASGC